MNSYQRIVASGLLAGGLATMFIAGHGAQASVLGTEQQRAKEALALRVLKSAPVQQQIKLTEEVFRQDPLASTPSGNATLHAAVESLALAAVDYAVDDDGDRPVIMWDTNHAHKWFGLDVPQSFFAIDSPDNVYRIVPLNGAARYEIRGKIKKPGPAQQTYVLYNSIPGIGENMTTAGHMMELGFLLSSKMKIAADGSFMITVDSDPAGDRPNHIQSKSDNAHMQLLVRDSLGDWTTQNPVALNVKRVSGPPLGPEPKQADLEKRAVEILASMGPYWRNWYHKHVYTLPVNQVTKPWARASGWGYNAFGSFDLADDEAWVVTLSPMGARYFGFQLADPWGVAIEFINRSGSLNQPQSKPNADGTYTYVVAAKDPGVYNWLDTNGLSAGVFTIRWQELPASVTSSDGAVRDVRVVKLKDLKATLAPETVFVTPEERKAQLAARAASYARRLMN